MLIQKLVQESLGKGTGGKKKIKEQIHSRPHQDNKESGGGHYMFPGPLLNHFKALQPCVPTRPVVELPNGAASKDLRQTRSQ